MARHASPAAAGVTLVALFFVAPVVFTTYRLVTQAFEVRKESELGNPLWLKALLIFEQSQNVQPIVQM